MNKPIDINPKPIELGRSWTLVGFQHISITEWLPNHGLGRTPPPLILPHALPSRIISIVSFLYFFLLFCWFFFF
jgi:hypothetical protein